MPAHKFASAVEHRLLARRHWLSVQPPAHVFRKMFGRRIAPLRLLAHGGKDNGVKVAPKLPRQIRRSSLTRLAGLTLADGALQFQRRLRSRFEWMSAGEKHKQQHAERINIARGS